MNVLKKLSTRLTLIIFVLAIIFPNGFLLAAGENKLINAGFEQAGTSSGKAKNWNNFHNGYTRVNTAHNGGWGVKLTTAVDSELAGAYQRIDLKQTVLEHVYIGGYVKGENIINSSGGYFGASMYAEIHLQNGRIAYWNSEANLGSFDWRLVGFNTAILETVNYPINYIYVVPILGRAQGTAYFDDIIAAVGGSAPEPVCGNGILEAGEVCDSNSQSCRTATGYGGSQLCNASCDGWQACVTTEFCGDRIINNGEVCDSNSQSCRTADGYGGSQLCNATCDGWQACVTTEFCGDGIINGPEECDGQDGVPEGYICTNQCQLVIDDSKCTTADYVFSVDLGVVGVDCHSGDKIDSEIVSMGSAGIYKVWVEVHRSGPEQPQPAEDFTITIDDQTGPEVLDRPGDEVLRFQYAGDFNFYKGDNNVIMQTASQCPPDTTPNSVEVVKLCLHTIAECGNGVIEEGEECDDGNTLNGDGCSAVCLIETPIPDDLVINPGFEQIGASPDKAANWQDYNLGYERTAAYHSGQWGIKLTNTGDNQLSGAYQRIDLNQSEVKPVFVGGYVKGSNIVKKSGSYLGASLYAEIHLQDGSVKYWNSLANSGTFDWRWIGFNTAAITFDGVNKFIDQPISHIFVVPILAYASGTAYFDDITVKEFTPTRAAVTLMFDDGEDSAHTTAKPILDNYNFKGSAAVITDMVGDEGFMDWQQISDLETSGWEIVSHSLTHQDLTKLNAAEIDRELSESKNILESQGLVIHNFALPYGAYNDYIINQGARYYQSVRAYELGDNPQGAFPYEVKVRSVVNSTTAAEVADWIAQAQDNNSWAVLVFHTISDSGDDVYYTQADVFADMMRAVADSGIEVVTYNRGLEIFGAER